MIFDVSTDSHDDGVHYIEWSPASSPRALLIVFRGYCLFLHWSQWPPNQSGGRTKWFCTSNVLLIAEPSGIKAADAIVTDSGALHVAGVPIANTLTVVIWEVTSGLRKSFQDTPKARHLTLLLGMVLPLPLHTCLAGRSFSY
ncbi:mediator of RNA polymerase II transcription subunit 16 isoform X2 [Olea europaea subsp. europaea]|uniref:Mediator of RNA polymerase II transcription subunit 16 isoform X2 n=1 Tax=Olea europaea subsp. europaea TaxID=158383 RepID=A0A8S0S6X5_OLEEU|nr:mediator of RNA polymerase II transcription subunit 16 isoform X2 [Olea europaea subsp. europaea]